MVNLLKRTARGIDIGLHWIETCFLTLCFSAMVLIIFAQLVLQDVFHQSLPWAGQAALYLLMWLVCFGSSAATRSRRHISFELLGRALPERTVRRISVVICAISAALCMAAVAMGVAFVLETRRIGAASSVMNLPVWIIYTALPLTAVMLSIRFILLMFSIPAPSECSDNKGLPE